MNITEQIELIQRQAKADKNAACLTVWRFVDGAAAPGWRNAPRDVVKVYGAVYSLLRRCELLTHHRQVLGRIDEHTGFAPHPPERWLFTARREDLERLMYLTREMFGANAALWQLALLHPHHPKICTITAKQKDRLAHLGVMPLVQVANLRAS